MADTMTAPATMAIQVTVNGSKRGGNLEPRTLLVHYLRDHLNLTGTHVGCDTSQCGACVVHLDGESVKSCTVLAVQANGSEITTIEGLAKDGDYHPVQQGFWEMHGLQCGYCTPGMIMASVSLLQRNPNPTEDEIRHGLEGNLCRCTGYQNIVKAVQYAAGQIGRDAGAADAPLPHDAHRPIHHDGTTPHDPASVDDWEDELAGESDES